MREARAGAPVGSPLGGPCFTLLLWSGTVALETSNSFLPHVKGSAPPPSPQNTGSGYLTHTQHSARCVMLCYDALAGSKLLEAGDTEFLRN